MLDKLDESVRNLLAVIGAIAAIYFAIRFLKLA